MTKNIKKILIYTILFTVFWILPKNAFASTLNFSPSSGNIPQFGSYTVQVRLNADSPVNAVSAVISYPSDKVDVSYINTNSSAFSIQAEQTVGGGVIKITRGNYSGVSGNINVASVTFKGKTLGSAHLSFIGGSAAPSAVTAGADTLSLGGSGSGNYNVVVAPTSSATAPDASLPVISNIQVKDISTHSATIYWTTDKKSDSTVEYGIEQTNLFLHGSTPGLTTEHQVTIEDPILIPGLHFFYHVKSRDASDNEAVSAIQELNLKGYLVKVTVLDINGKPVSGVNVSLYSFPQTSKTSASGEADFQDVTPGKHLIKVQLPNGEKSQEIEVLKQDGPQAFTVNLDTQDTTTLGSKINIYMIIGGAGILLILVGVVLMVMSEKRRSDLTHLQ